MRDTDLVSSVAAAVADGDAVSWPEAERLAASPGERAIVRRLRDISALTTTRTSHDVAAARLPLPFRGVLLVAALQVAAIPLAALTRGDPSIARFLPEQVLLAFAFSAAAVILYTGGRADRRAQWLMAFYVLSAASFSHPILHSSTIALVRHLRHFAFDGFAVYALWRFAGGFPRTERFAWIDRAALALGSAALAVAVALAVNDLLVAASAAAAGTPLARFARESGSEYYWVPYYPLLLGAFVTSAIRALRARAEERQRVAMFALVLAAGALPLLVRGVLHEAGPAALAAWMETGIQEHVIDAIVLGSVLLIPPLTTYVVLARGALSVRLVLHRAARYVLARASVLVIASLPAAALARYAFERRDLPLAAIVTNGRGPLLAAWLAAALALLAFRRALLRLVDRQFLHAAVDRQEALARSVAAVRGANGAAEVAAMVAREIEQLFGSRAGALQHTESGAVPLHGPIPPLPRSSALVALACDSRVPIVVGDRSGLFHLLPEADRAWILATKTDVVLPLQGADGRTLASVVSSAPDSGLGWSRQDLATLTTLAEAAALALDRAPASAPPRDATDAAWPIECTACGEVAASAARLSCACGAGVLPSLLPATLHGKFGVERRIGRGGMGVVYRGRDLALGRAVALKVLPAIAPGAVERMSAEARAMAAIIHPQLGLIFGTEMWDRTPVLVMEFLGGGTLAERLRRGALPVDEAIDLGVSLCTAVGALHAAGVLHGDIKPSNIAYSDAGVAKLIDFGLARLAGASDGSAGGTPLYLPPEAFDGALPSPAFDLWALAVVLYEALAGTHPFRGVASRKPPPDVRAVNPDVPDAVAVLLRDALSSDPARRPASAAQFAASGLKP